MTTPVNSYDLLDRSDKTYAQLKVLQKGHPGKLFNSLTEETFDELNLIILRVRKEFRVWPEGEGLSKYPKYLSDDLKNLIQLDPETGERIGIEPLEESTIWKNRKNSDKAKTQYYFIAVIPGKPNLVIFRIGGLGFQRARRFLNKAQNTGKQIFEFVTRISVLEEQSRYGTIYVPQLEITDQPLPEEWTAERTSQLCQEFIRSTRSRPAALQAPSAT